MGSPLLGDEYDPVTTDPKGEAPVTVTPARYDSSVANLQPVQHAGSWQGNTHVPSYISAYFDGEGCFSVAIAPRPRLKIGWEVRPSVSVSQNGDRAEVIELINHHFGCGSTRNDPGDKTIKWECRSLQLLIELVLPHFEVFPMLSGKQADYVSLRRICHMMSVGGHHTTDGLARIVEIARMMNPSGTRRYEPDEILEDLRTR